MSTVARLDPFRRIVGVQWRTEEEPTETPLANYYWAIIYAGDDVAEPNYVGEGDAVKNEFVNAGTGYFTHVGTTGSETSSPPPTISSSWSTITASPHIRRYEIRRFTASTAEELPPSNVLDWELYDFDNGWNFFVWGIGRTGGGSPDVNCPPASMVFNGPHWSEEHCVNWRDWQIAIGSGTVPSYTLYETPGPGMGQTALYCIPGA